MAANFAKYRSYCGSSGAGHRYLYLTMKLSSFRTWGTRTSVCPDPVCRAQSAPVASAFYIKKKKKKKKKRFPLGAEHDPLSQLPAPGCALPDYTDFELRLLGSDRHAIALPQSRSNAGLWRGDRRDSLVTPKSTHDDVSTVVWGHSPDTGSAVWWVVHHSNG